MILFLSFAHAKVEETCLPLQDIQIKSYVLMAAFSDHNINIILHLIVPGLCKLE